MPWQYGTPFNSISQPLLSVSHSNSIIFPCLDHPQSSPMPSIASCFWLCCSSIVCRLDDCSSEIVRCWFRCGADDNAKLQSTLRLSFFCVSFCVRPGSRRPTSIPNILDAALRTLAAATPSCSSILYIYIFGRATVS